MRTCTKCQKIKPESEFSIRAGKATNQCLPCKREYNNANYKNRSLESKQEKISLAAARRDEARRNLWDYKSTHPCAACGESDPIVLEFDHIDTSEKESEVGKMIKRGFSWENILKEISKCQVLCANCHRRKTYHQLGWYARI